MIRCQSALLFIGLVTHYIKLYLTNAKNAIIVMVEILFYSGQNMPVTVKLTPPIIFSIYYRQANAIDASVRKQIALEIVFTQVP